MKKNSPTLFLLALSCFCFHGCDPEQKKEGLKIVHYPGTDKIHQEIEMKNGKKNGYAKEYFKNGKLKCSQHYINDTLNDSSLTYHSNGQLLILQYFKNKLRHGCWKDFSPTGQLIKEINFKDGMLDGISTEYTYRTGRLQTKINFKNGAKDGYEEFYYPNGNPKSKILYKNGDQTKDMQEWLESGKEIKHDIKFTVVESNKVLLENTLTYYIQLSDPKPDDEVYKIYAYEKYGLQGREKLKKTGSNNYELNFNVGKGGFVMEQITIAAYRKSILGNTFVKVHSFNASANNF